MSAEASSIPSLEEAARRAAETEADYYIVTPGSPWGGTTGVVGPLTLSQARERLDVWLPLQMPECPPKLLRLVEDYATDEAAPRP